MAVMLERNVSKDYKETATKIFQKRNCSAKAACSWIKMVDGNNDMIDTMNCSKDTNTDMSTAPSVGGGGGGGGGGGDGCEEYIPSKENVSNLIKTDIEADFVELFVKLRPETRLKIGHHFDRQTESLEGQPLQGFVRSCLVGGEDCSDLR